ncbi:GNAT family N-acetyltransferase [uncultured Roseibium sp.]|uniref:GNAT family N-acetyltransferase n=1 Tax=uncultured Roseibium sp. TaxID=1936171 RepID=UPI00259AE03E|nr:GNAT family N-acetyltransferase [uncultured Roseibium sp.]
MTITNAAENAPAKLEGAWLAFDDLSGRDVHDLLKLRQDVFVVEQDCAFPEIDGQDPDALHYVLRNPATGDLAGALRVFLADTDSARGNQASRIGRVVIAPSHRGLGLGRSLMQVALDKCRSAVPCAPVNLSAQAHLEEFYASFGFARISENYLEDGIWHLDMRCAAGPQSETAV